MTTMKDPYDSDALADLLEQDDRYRVLRSVPQRYTNMPGGAPPEGRCIAIVDVETTGLDVATDRLIELAIMLVFVSPDGQVVGHLGPMSWLQDPGIPLDPKISMITGLSDADLAGQAINDRMAFNLLARADSYLAHNAKFDASWIEKRYPGIAGRPWLCSCAEIPWLELSCEGRAQNHLLVQHGLFANAHRAGDDVWSLFQLLQQSLPDPVTGKEQTHLQRLLDASAQTSFLVEAVKAPYAAKDRLKARQYRWNPDRKIWSKELGQQDLAAERSWYRTQQLPPFRTVPITACERHR